MLNSNFEHHQQLPQTTLLEEATVFRVIDYVAPPKADHQHGQADRTAGTHLVEPNSNPRLFRLAAAVFSATLRPVCRAGAV